jgi:hypothetical protein
MLVKILIYSGLALLTLALILAALIALGVLPF